MDALVPTLLLLTMTKDDYDASGEEVPVRGGDYDHARPKGTRLG